MLDDGEVAVVEWGEAIAGVLGRDYLLARLGLLGDGDDDRVITFEPHGSAWQSRVAALRRGRSSRARRPKPTSWPIPCPAADVQAR